MFQTNQPDPMFFLWFSYGFPMVFLLSYGFPMVFTKNSENIHLTRPQPQIPMASPSMAQIRMLILQVKRDEMLGTLWEKNGNDGKKHEVEVLNKTLLVNVKQVYSWILNGGYSSEKWLNMTLWLVAPLPRVSVW